MTLRSVVLLGLLGVVGVFGVGCNNGKNKGTAPDLARPGDGGSGINVTLTIVGEGTVEVDQQLACSSLTDPCTLNVAIGSTTSVTALPANGWQFMSWSCMGQISTSATLDLALQSGAQCTVTFVKASETLMVTVTDGRGGTGGVVTSSAGGLACGTGMSVCSAALEWGSTTTLTATADPFYTFAGWEGDCTGSDSPAEITISKPTHCIARFAHVQFPLTLTVVGQGTLASTPLECTSGTCGPVDVDEPEVVSITATPAPNYRVDRWEGDCLPPVTGTTSSVSMTAARSCTVTFVLVDRLLATTVQGDGAITRDPEGAAVGPDASYTHGDVVTLTAVPDANRTFSGWSGDCSGTALTTTVTMDADKSCTATFVPTPRTLSVTVVGPGSVTSAPAGIDTAATAPSALFDHGTVVTLTAAPAINYEVAGWTGDCGGTATTADVTMNGDKACIVTFQLVKHPLLVTVIGSGSVKSAPAGVDTAVGANDVPFVYDTDVTLTATPNGGAVQISFLTWGGDCAAFGNAPTATVDMTTAHACTAEFTITPYNLTVAVAPAGSGNVTGKRNGAGADVINCGAGSDCAENAVPSNESVLLVAAPNAGYRFDRWTGCSSSTSATLNVPLNSDKDCTANFVKQWNLTVSRTLTNGVSVATLDPGTVSATGIDCGADCARSAIDEGQTVALAASSNPGFAFVGWSGTAVGCSGAATTVTVGTGGTAGATYTCAASWAQTATVAVATSPSAAGSVTGADTVVVGGSGVGTSVALTRPADSGSYAFSGWSGSFTTGSGVATGCTGTGPTAVVSISSATANAVYTCTASFGALWNLTVTKSLTNGSTAVDPGAITGSGVNCGADCAESGLGSTETVTLTAPVTPGFAFLGWTGTATGCTGNTTSVTVGSGGTPGTTYTCGASWEQTATVVGAASPSAVGTVTGGGTVTVGGGSVGTTVTLTRPADSGSYAFTGWSGSFTTGSGVATGCSGTASTATVKLTSATANAVYRCTASYSTLWNLTVTKRLSSGAAISAALDPGTVTATGATISCGADCSDDGIASGTSVQLTAPTSAGFVFLGWSGTATGCSGTSATVTVSYGNTPGATLTCNPSWAQTATVVGAATPAAVGPVTGGGPVTVGPSGVATSVTLTRPADSGSYLLTGWSGAFTTGSGTATGCSGTGDSVTVQLSAASASAVYTCTATYQTSWNLTVGRSLTSGATITASLDPGPVTSTGGAISCGTDCSESALASTASVTLNATVGGSFAFKSWSGTATGCSGTSPSVTVSYGGTPGTTYTCNALWDQTATVAAATSPSAAGTTAGSGTVIVGPSGTGTTAVLTHPAASGSYGFTGWSGAFTSGSGVATGCSGSGATVTVAVTSASANAVYTCTAQFNTLWSLTVTKSLTSGAAISGSLDPGTVTATGATISCGADCGDSGLVSTASVQLSAPSGSGFSFKQWTGTATGCSGTSPTVTVSYGGAPGTTYTCNPSWDQTGTIVGVASPSGAGTVTGGGAVIVGPVGTGTQVTLSRPASTSSYSFTGWSGSFTTGSGTATGCSGSGTTATVRLSDATAGAVYTCTASYSTLWNLAVTKSLTNGSTTVDPGTVTGTGISCGGDCSESGLVSTSSLTLTAPNAPSGGGFTFVGWSGTATGCSGTGTTATVSSAGTPGTTYTCNAQWAQTATVTGAITPSGVGSVTGGGAVVVGGSGVGTSVTLSRPAASGSYSFVGWSGAFTSGSGSATGCSGTGTSATVAISDATANAIYTCTATYNTLWSLSVTKSLTSGAAITASLDPGTVTATGISCGADCSESGLLSTATVALGATTSAGYVFKGWTGTATGCSGSATSVTVSYAGTPGTTYTCNPSWDQTATVAGVSSPVAAGTVTGGGTVVVGGAGVATSATLTRPANTASYTFTGWSGAFTTGSGTASGCSGSGPTASVSISAATAGAVYTCTATFNSLWNLAVSKSLTNGSTLVDPGTITGSGIACGADCTENGLTTATTVTLTAPNVPSGGGFSFVGWSGTATGCSGPGASVTVSTGGAAGATYSCNAQWAQTATVAGATSPAAVGTVTGGGVVVVGASGVGTSVTLSKPANSGSYAFTGWSGSFTSGSGTAAGCSGSGATAVVSITSASANAVYTCTAQYSTLWSLSVTRSLTSGGTISASLDPGTVTGTGISCGSDCGETGYASTATVTLTAPSNPGFAFKDWSGTATGCTGTATSVTVSYGGTPGTTYTCNPRWDQTASIAGATSPAAVGTVTGGGTVLVGAAGIATSVTLSKPANSGSYTFTGWSGSFTSGTGTASGCSGTGVTATVSLSAASANAVYICTAQYSTLWNLQVSKALTNAASTPDPGTISGTGISCGADCNENGLSSSASVTLTAPNVPSGGGFSFVNWSGTAIGCSGTAASVTVSTGGTAGATYSCTATWRQNATVVGAASPAAVGTVTGGGTVVVGGAGVATSVTLSKPANSGSYTFTSWSGSFTSGSGVASGCSGSGATVTVSISSASANATYTCTASYNTLWNLSVSKTLSNGAALDPGTVTGTGISCGADCVENGLVSTTSVTLTRPSPAGYTFLGWSGTASGCAGVGTTATVSYNGTPGTTYTCNAGYAQNVTITGTANLSGGTTGVTPASTNAVVGGAGIGTIVTIDRGTVQSFYRFSGWSGSFTSGSGTVAAGSCSGTGATTTVQVNTATVGATYACVANFVQRGTVTISPAPTNGTATVESAAAAPNNCAAGSSCTVDAGIVTTLRAVANSGYRFGSWSGTGCSVASSTSATTTLTVSGSTNHTCTASFIKTYDVTVRIVPTPTVSNSFGSVTGSCAIGSTQSSCSTTVDTGSTVSFNAFENLNGASQRTSRFVRWSCTNGSGGTSTALSISPVTSNITCVAQFYGLWARYYRSSSTTQNIVPKAVDLPLAVRAADGLVNSSSHILVDGYGASSGGNGSDALIAADDEVTAPAFSNRAVPTTAYVPGGLVSDGADQVTSVGRHTLADSTYRATFWPFDLNRNATTGRENSFGREIFTEYDYANQVFGSLTYSWDGVWSNGAYSAIGYALGGISAFNVTYNFGSGTTTSTANTGWVMRTNLVGTASQSLRFSIPQNIVNGACDTALATTVTDVMWDPDATNPNGVVAVGNWTTSGTPAATYSFLAKLNSNLDVVAIRTLVPSSNANLTAQAVVRSVGGTGYSVFGVMGAAPNVTISMLTFPYNLSTPSVDDGFYVLDAGTGAAMNMSFGDVVVEASRYVVLGAGTPANGTADLYALFISGAGVAQGAMQFGAPGLSEAASKIIKPRDGGYLITASAILVQDPVAFAYWTARTDENFFVPFNGTAPGNQLASLGAARVGEVDIKFAGGSVACNNTNPTWWDKTLPTANTVTTAGAPFTAVVNVQAP